MMFNRTLMELGELFRFGVIEPYSELEDFQKIAARIYRREFLGAYNVNILKHTENYLLETSQRELLTFLRVVFIIQGTTISILTKFLPALRSLLKSGVLSFLI